MDPIDLSLTWPKGRLCDIQIKVKTDEGGMALIGALNGRKECMENFFDHIEFTRISFDSKMEGGAGCTKHKLLELQKELHRYMERHDYDALTRIDQKLLSMINDSQGK